MARGINAVSVSGNVGGDIAFGETNGGDPFCTFDLAVEDKNKHVTWVRVNIYGPIVDIARKRLARGGYVVVDGELMNHSNKSDLEIRCEDIVFLQRGDGHERRNGRREESVRQQLGGA